MRETEREKKCKKVKRSEEREGKKENSVRESV